MPLDAAPANSRTQALTDAFAELGAPPRTRTAKDRLAFEYWAASVLAQLAEIRRAEAKRGAVAGGVLPDHTAEPMPVGTFETVYSGALVTITVKVANQPDRVAVPALIADLEAAGVARALLRRLVKRHTTSFAGAHTFTASLTTG